jgi:predicted RNA-binding Zn ribbon-like protein
MTFTIDARAVQAAGLTLVGEPVAIDLVNTEKLATNPPVELLPDDEANRAFWALQAGRLQIPSELPSLERVRSLRSAIRSLLESRLSKLPAEPSAIHSLNSFASAAPASPQLNGDWTAGADWQAPDGATALLGAVARSAIDALTGPGADRLHRCAADDCSMIFVATNAKRQWCTAAGCGNRQRVARHASRQRQAAALATA